MSAYLFTHFTETKGDREYVWFAVSRDGLHWKDLGNDEPLLASKVGTKGVRDPFIVYDEKLKNVFYNNICQVHINILRPQNKKVWRNQQIFIVGSTKV